MVKTNERIAVPNKQIEGPNKRIQVPKGIQIGPIFAMQNAFKYNKKLFAWQRNPSWSSQLRHNKFGLGNWEWDLHQAQTAVGFLYF